MRKPSPIKGTRSRTRFSQSSKNRKKVFQTDRKIKTIAGDLVRRLERNLRGNSTYNSLKVLSQTKNSQHKIYSLHEPDVLCISKGEDRELRNNRRMQGSRFRKHLNYGIRAIKNKRKAGCSVKGQALNRESDISRVITGSDGTFIRDAINIMLAAAAFNFKRAMRLLLCSLIKSAKIFLG